MGGGGRGRKSQCYRLLGGSLAIHKIEQHELKRLCALKTTNGFVRLPLVDNVKLVAFLVQLQVKLVWQSPYQKTVYTLEVFSDLKSL